MSHGHIKALAMVAAGAAMGMFASDAMAITIVPNADSYISKNNPDTNFGNASTVRLRGGTFDTYKAYFRFSLSEVTGTIVSASFSFEPNSGGSWIATATTYNVYGLNDGHAGENWIEGNGGTDNDPAGEITWNNAPANASNLGFDSDATLLGHIDAPAGTSERLVFSSAALVSFLNADTDGQVTLMLAPTDTGLTTIQSLAPRTDATRRPRLDVVVPEPTAMSLLLAGGVLCLRRRKA